jgi:hypothetical protein
MTLITVKKTGHVLGVVTRESDPEGTLEPADVAGERLLVRFVGNPSGGLFNASFFVPADELALEVTDFDEMVVGRARDFYLNADKQLVATSGTPTINNPTSNLQIRVGVGAAVTAKTPVWIQVVSSTDPTKTQVREGEIDVGQTNADIEVLPLDSGGLYVVLAMVGGHDQLVEDISVP